jgi:hypothetical protein
MTSSRNASSEDKHRQKQHEEDEENYSGNVRCLCRDSAKPENRGNNPISA